MALWSATKTGWTPTAVADTTNMTNSGYIALQGGSSTQRIRIWEIYLGGEATTSTVNQMVVARDSTVGATSLTGMTLAAMDPSTAALGAPPAPFSSATTVPQRSSTLYLLTPSFNAYGGIVKWNPAEGKEPSILGNTASLGEISISSKSGAGVLSSHILFEPM